MTGSAGLVGSEAARAFARIGLQVVGIDNDLRRTFFGEEASTAWNRAALQSELGARYRHVDVDIRDSHAVDRLVSEIGDDLTVVIHAAAQPSHDWAASDPVMDFDINARATLHLLEAVRRHAAEAVFVFCSTNKVYGDAPNRLPLVELDRRYEIHPDHPYQDGIAEDLSVDECMHSLFGVSKLAADVLVQEYGRYFGLLTACFRAGTITGPAHSATKLHGFLAYVMRCTMTGTPYTVIGYDGKQVRDAIHAVDLVRAFVEFFRAPRSGAVYNIGGGRHSNASVLEAIDLCESIAERQLAWSYIDEPRSGDHIWWIGDNGRFQRDYPGWTLGYDLPAILAETHEANRTRWHG